MGSIAVGRANPATTVYGWKFDFIALAVANGWVVHDDQLTNTSAVSGYVILKAAGDSSGKGFIEVFFDGTSMKFRAWHLWNATTHTGGYSSIQVSRAIDLASGFRYYMASSGAAGVAGLAIAFETSSSFANSMVACIKPCDVFASGLALRSDLEPPKAMIVEPTASLVYPSHYVAISSVNYNGRDFGANTGQWEMNSGDWAGTGGSGGGGLLAWSQLFTHPYTLGGQYTKNKAQFTDWNEWNGALWNLDLPAYQPRLIIGHCENLDVVSTTGGVILAECIYNFLPEVWKIKNTGNDGTWAKVITSRQGLYAAPGKFWLGVVMDASQTTMTLAGDYVGAGVPTSGTFDLLVDKELIRCSSRAGAVVTIATRGFQSIAAIHAIGAGAASFTDDFNRADGAPGSNYTLEGTSANATGNITSNKIRFIKTNTTAAIVRALVNVGAFANFADVDLSATFNNQANLSSGATNAEIQWRRTAANNYYCLRMERVVAGLSLGWGLYKIVAGVETSLTTLASFPKLNTSTGIVRVTMIGDTINVYLNGEKLPLTARDTSITAAGQISIGANLPNVNASTEYIEFDDLSIARVTTNTTVDVVQWGYKVGKALIMYGLGGGN
jgi:hypothetical protein